MTEEQKEQDGFEIPAEGPAPGTAPAPENSPATDELAEARRLADQLKDQLLRKAAEFENYRRRTEAEYASLIRSANESLIFALLPILDDFDRSLKAGKERTDAAQLLKGIELIQAKLVKTLEGEGLAPFESAGKPFDVHFHDALLQIPRNDVPPHTVVEEVARGYMLNDRILRHAKVVVSMAPDSAAGGAADGNANGDANGDADADGAAAGEANG